MIERVVKFFTCHFEYDLDICLLFFIHISTHVNVQFANYLEFHHFSLLNLDRWTECV